jgi:hypothetical protein
MCWGGSMAKSRGFSIYLLKEGYDATNALQQDHVLDPDVGARGLPETPPFSCWIAPRDHLGGGHTLVLKKS